jgi:GT2 family glycosyltransferase
MSARVTLAMCVFNQLALTRACMDSLRATTEPFRLVVVDNGSTDGTREFFERFEYPFPLRFDPSGTNESVIASLNRAWRQAETEFICLLHNDTEMLAPDWLSRLLAALGEPGVALAGLYGVKRLRRDGRYVGRTIVHSLAEGPTVRPPWEEVAVVDGVCMCLSRERLASVGGLDEGYGFFHGYDRDLSFAIREAGGRCLVVYAPFAHQGGGTRARDFAGHPDRERGDLALRQAALNRFVAKYGHRLPCDVRSGRQRVGDWLAAKILPGFSDRARGPST